uniref:Uncharacterized protein n=1 Tax=Euplotes crassus TaxID=5936 RepID=A0A7S3KMF5_EUPCR|mmetsp:Transcript_33210/g.32628  ORF Transcript_33210/g.32628 Transcript_33210/m.32628 type:complete len:174 (+) Transcript_33210:1086-1607(+)|eukprot:CAMPEP_0196996256 /NCGR_PEP_ID=MMETSP1380-20130617/2175_1 /TAXON_ID=5936 /ORGANISM="Euplotes crassus, Strain CT5" /LENGTH=173 /DNA_ID=CAMNT_0042412157 /DNA_START=1276 /DNA_END=1797 /DNA_ORIENTATION=-
MEIMMQNYTKARDRTKLRKPKDHFKFKPQTNNLRKIKKDRDKRKYIRKSSLKEHFPIKTIRKQKKLPDIVPSFLDSEFTNEKTSDEHYDNFKYSLKDMIDHRSNPKDGVPLIFKPTMRKSRENFLNQNVKYSNYPDGRIFRLNEDQYDARIPSDIRIIRGSLLPYNSNTRKRT